MSAAREGCRAQCNFRLATSPARLAAVPLGSYHASHQPQPPQTSQASTSRARRAIQRNRRATPADDGNLRPCRYLHPFGLHQLKTLAHLRHDMPPAAIIQRRPRTHSMRAFQLQPSASGSCRHNTTLKSLRLACLASSSSSRRSSVTISIATRAMNVSE